MYETLLFYHNKIYIESLIAEFENHQFHFVLSNSVKDAIHLICTQPIKICVIEQMHYESMSFLSALRLVDKSVLTLLLCEGNTPDDKQNALETACDEFIFKPVVSRELKLRLVALAKKDRNYHDDDDEIFTLGRSTIDFNRRLFSTCDSQVLLTRKEASLLKLLLRYKNRLVAHEFILEQIWNTGNYYAAKSMVVYINKLRKKIKADPSILLVNLHGSGYMLKEALAEEGTAV